MTTSIMVSQSTDRVPAHCLGHLLNEWLDSIEIIAAELPDEATARDAVCQLERAVSRMTAAKLKVVAAAARLDVASVSGAAGTGAWLSAATHESSAAAAAQVRLSESLTDSLALTGAALDAGLLTSEHAAVIASATAHLPQELTDSARERVEATLVAAGKRTTPARLRREAQRAIRLAEAEADAAAGTECTAGKAMRSEEERALERSSLALRDNHDGTMSGHFTVPTHAGQMLRRIVQQLASPSRSHEPGCPALLGSAFGASTRLAPQGRGTADAADAEQRCGTADGRLAHDIANGRQPRGWTDPADAAGARPANDMAEPVPQAPTAHSTGSGARGDCTCADSRPAPGDAAAWATVDWRQRYGKAFVEILESLPTDRISGKVAATIVVTCDLDTLWTRFQAASESSSGAQEGCRPSDGSAEHWPPHDDPASRSSRGTPEDSRPHHAEPGSGETTCPAAQGPEPHGGDSPGRTDTGDALSASQVRRLACEAGILPTVLSGASLPLDLGRMQRYFTEAQRVALATRYSECAADGCDRPYAWTHLHHLDPWEHGGETNLDRAIPLCGHHHRRIHDSAYRHWVRLLDRGIRTVSFHRRP